MKEEFYEKPDLQQLEESLSIRRNGVVTDIHLSESVSSGAPLFDAEYGMVNVPVLLDLLNRSEAESGISRLIRFCENDSCTRSFHQVTPGLLMCLYDHEVTEAKAFAPFWIDGWALLKINLHGNIAFRIGTELLELNEASGMLIYGAELPINKKVYSEGPETSVTILFNPRILHKEIGESPNTLNELLGNGSQESGSTTQLLRIDGRLAELIRQLMGLSREDFLYFLEVEAIAKNILLQSLRLLKSQSFDDSPSCRLRGQDIEKLTLVKGLLDSDYSNQFSLEGLSRQAGLNRRKLTEGFKGLFGATVSEYLLRQRMIAAADMLRRGVLATEVAHQVGYKEQSSFTRAFKRYYGILPRDFCT